MAIFNKVLAFLIKDGSGNTLGTGSNPLQVSTSGGSGGAKPAVSEIDQLQFVDDGGNVLGTSQNPLVLAGLSSGVQTFSISNVNSNTFTDDVPDTSCVLISAPITLGTINASAAVFVLAAALSVNVTAVTTSTTLVLQICLRDSTVQPAVTPTQFVNAAGHTITVAISGISTIKSYGNSSNSLGTINIPGVGTQTYHDSYNNVVAVGDNLVIDVGFYFETLKANQSALVSGNVQYLVSMP